MVSDSEPAWNDFDAILLPVDPKQGLKDSLKGLPRPSEQEILAFAERVKFKALPKQCLAFDSATRRRIVVAILPRQAQAFSYLEWARKVLKSLLEAKPKKVLVALPNFASSALLVDALVSAKIVAEFEPKKYSGKKKTEKEKVEKTVFSFYVKDSGAELTSVIAKSTQTAEATNLVRQLSHLAGNDLTPGRYVLLATDIAKKQGLKTEFFNLEKLAKLGAGAFCAVAQGSTDRGGGILKLSYHPKQYKKTLSLVGKGITFDTGGNNLKTGPHMFGMHQDMAGSAVALSTILLAKKQSWPYRVDAYLAISDNVIGPDSYRPNDVVTSMKGLTIEVIDTDAEGRMVLSDTLYLSSKDKPDLVVDFATLTGAVGRAIGHNYSGGFANRRRLLRRIEKAGIQSGERVWPFPNDKDYIRCLKSEVADIKQCRLTGGADHIEASLFLSKFLEKGVPWAHIDLAAINSEGGLAHVGSEFTGFGVRFAAAFVAQVLGE